MSAVPSPARTRGRRIALLTSTAFLAAVPGAHAATMSGGVGALTFTAAAGEANDLTVSATATDIVLTENGPSTITAGISPCTISGGGKIATCPSTLVTSVVLALGDLGDTTNFGAYADGVPTTINGEAGQDVLNGSPLVDTINGGDDNDAVNAMAGADVISGGAGADVLKGGDDTDLATYATTTVANRITLDGIANDGAMCPGAMCEADNVGGVSVTGGDVENVTGGSMADTIIGNDGVNTLTGGAGDDSLDGKGANDSLVGGAGTGDTASYATRAAPATIVATPAGGGDSSAVPVEADTFTTIENVTGGQGDDTLAEAAASANVLDGGPGNDILKALTEASGPGDSPIADTFVGGTGSDTVDYSARTTADAAAVRLTVTLDGTANDGVADELDNVGGADDSVEKVIGGTANDTITGNAAANTLDGGPGNDTLNGSTGADVLIGGTGTDTTTYAGRTSPVNVTLNDTLANDGGTDDGPANTRDDIQTENVTGGDGNDVLTGDTGANALVGGGGDDLLDGLAGADTLDGQGGTDTVTYAARTAPIIASIGGGANDGEAAETDNIVSTVENLVGGSGGNTLTGSSANNVLVGGVGIDAIDGGGGDDTTDGGTGADVLDGSVGTDTLSYATRGTKVSVTLGDNMANDGVAGENDSVTGFETVDGGTAGDDLTGDLLANTLNGNGGDDVLNGGEQVVPDTLNGGPGLDTASYVGRTEPLTLSLDGVDNDGADTENDVLTTIENLTGGNGADTIRGNAAVNVLTGGAGIDAITSRDTVGDTVLCGPGTPDTVTADLNDTVDSDCETVDRGPKPTLSAADVSITEGNTGTSNAIVTVTLTPAPTAPVAVDYTTADGTATQPSDYTSTTGTLSFAAGETSKDVAITVVGDTAVEPDETLTLALSNATNANLPTGPTTVTVTNDDSASTPTPTPTPGTLPVLSIASVKVAEGNTGTTNAVFTVSLSAAGTGTVTAPFRTADNTATQPSDYTSTAGTLTFAPGERTKTITVPVKGDTTVESDEAFGVIITGQSGATTATTPLVAVGTITNDDKATAAKKVRPKVSLSAKPARDKTKPYSFVLAGKLTFASSVAKSSGCRGKVVITVKRLNKKTVKAYTAAVKSNCAYKVTAKLPASVKPTKLKATARFGGNTVLLTAASAQRSLRAG